jgi:hypothetical protein
MMFQAVAMKNLCSWYSIADGNNTVTVYDERGGANYMNISEVNPNERDIVTLFVHGNHFESIVPKSLQSDDLISGCPPDVELYGGFDETYDDIEAEMANDECEDTKAILGLTIATTTPEETETQENDNEGNDTDSNSD